MGNELGVLCTPQMEPHERFCAKVLHSLAASALECGKKWPKWKLDITAALTERNPNSREGIELRRIAALGDDTVCRCSLPGCEYEHDPASMGEVGYVACPLNAGTESENWSEWLYHGCTE